MSLFKRAYGRKSVNIRSIYESAISAILCAKSIKYFETIKCCANALIAECIYDNDTNRMQRTFWFL